MTFAELLYKFFAYLYNNKQAILGSLVAALAFIQGNDALRDLLSESVYAWTMFAVGLLTVLFARSASGGSVASRVLPPSVPPAKSTEAGFIRPAMLAVLVTVAACAGTKAAYQAAETPDEYAFVLASHYATLIEQAAALKERPTTPPEAVRAMQRADLSASPAIGRLRELRDAYLAVKSAENEAALQAAINDAVRLVADLIRAIQGAGGQATSMTDQRILRDALEAA